MTKKNNKSKKGNNKKIAVPSVQSVPVGITDVDILDSNAGFMAGCSGNEISHSHNHSHSHTINDGLSNGLYDKNGINKGLIDDKPKNNQLTDLLFDNPMSRAIMKSMSAEEIQQYKNIGEEMYSNIDFEKSEVLSNMPPFISGDAIAYITTGIQSGLLPRDLDDNEKAIMSESFGPKWYEKFGYSENDL